MRAEASGTDNLLEASLSGTAVNMDFGVTQELRPQQGAEIESGDGPEDLASPADLSGEAGQIDASNTDPTDTEGGHTFPCDDNTGRVG